MPPVCVLLQVGLKVLREDGRVLACYEDMSDVIFHAELGASAAILDQGYTIDSLMLRYQGVDWRNQSNWNCNAGYVRLSYSNSVLRRACLSALPLGHDVALLGQRPCSALARPAEPRCNA